MNTTINVINETVVPFNYDESFQSQNKNDSPNFNIEHNKSSFSISTEYLDTLESFNSPKPQLVRGTKNGHSVRELISEFGDTGPIKNKKMLSDSYHDNMEMKFNGIEQSLTKSSDVENLSVTRSSTDSLDKMSSLSTSSRSSNRLLSMADVDVIVGMQEKS